jgi:SNF2 family DNA or RNA helicase
MIKYSLQKRIFCAFLSFIVTVNFSLPSYAQNLFNNNTLNLPAPGSLLGLSNPFAPPILLGLQIDPQDPFKFDFIIDTGESKLSSETIEAESKKLIKYFLVGLTINEEDLWVNLSPYEKDRMIPEHFGQTEMGRDMLAQDYILKQITASLIYPEDKIGKAFWDNVYEKAGALYGTTDIPIDTFNKVWVVPKIADIYEDGNTALITDSQLKVLMEEDYIAMYATREEGEGTSVPADSEISKEMMKNLIIPEIEKEVNTGENFTTLRQIYNSLILAYWFKQNLKASIWETLYIGKNKVKGVDTDDNAVVEKIYDQYLAAFKEGVFNYVQEEYDPAQEMIVERKYFSGGVLFGKQLKDTIKADKSMRASQKSKLDDLSKKGRILKVSSAVTTPDVNNTNPADSEFEDDVPGIYVYENAKFANGRIVGGTNINADSPYHKNMLSSFINRNTGFTGVIANYSMNSYGGLKFDNKRYWDKRAGCEKKSVYIVMESGVVTAIFHAETGEELFPYYENFFYSGAEVIEGEIKGGTLLNQEGMMNRKQVNAFFKENPDFTGVVDKVPLGTIGELVRFNGENFWSTRKGFANKLVRIVMKNGKVVRILDEENNIVYPFQTNFVHSGAVLENGKVTGGELLNPNGAIDRQALNRLLRENPGFTGVLTEVPLNSNGGLTDFNGQNYWTKLAHYENAHVTIVMAAGELSAVYDQDGKQLYPYKTNLIYPGATVVKGEISGAENLNINGLSSKQALNQFLNNNPRFTGVIDNVELSMYGGLKDLNGKDYWTYLPGLENQMIRLVFFDGEVIEAYSENGDRVYPFEENYAYLDARIENGKIVGGTLINKGGSPGRNAFSNLLNDYPGFNGVIDKLRLDSKGGLKFRKKGYWQHKKGYENALVTALVRNEIIVEVYDQEGNQIYSPSENNYVYLGSTFENGKITGGKLINEVGLRDRQDLNEFLKNYPDFSGVIDKVPLTQTGGFSNFLGESYWNTRSAYKNALVTVVMIEGKVINIYGPDGEELYPFTEHFIYEGASFENGKIKGGTLVNPQGLMDRQALNRFFKSNPNFTGMIDRVKLNGVGGLGLINGKQYWLSMPGHYNAYIRLVMENGIITAAFSENGSQIYPFTNHYIYEKQLNEDGSYSENLLTPGGLINRQALNKWFEDNPDFTGTVREVELTKGGGLTDFNKKDYWKVMSGYENAKVTIEMEKGEVVKVTAADGKEIYPFTENFIYRGGEFRDGKVVGGELLNPGGHKSRPLVNTFLRDNPGFTGILTHIKLNASGGLTDFNGRDYWSGRTGFEGQFVTLVMQNGELIKAFAEDGTEMYPFHENYLYAGATYRNGEAEGGALINWAGFADRQGLNTFLKANPGFTGVIMKVKLHHSGGLMNLDGKDYWSMRPGFEDAYVNIVMKNGEVTHVYSEKGKELYPFKENYIYADAVLEGGQVSGGKLITKNGLYTRKSINETLAAHEGFSGVIRKIRLSPIGRIGQIKNILYDENIEGYENELADLVISNDKVIAAYHHTTGQLIWTEDKTREAVKMLNDLWKNGEFEKLLNLFGEESTQRILFHFLGNITPQQIMRMSTRFKEQLPRSKRTKSKGDTFREFVAKLTKIEFFNLPASVEFESMLTREIFFITYGYIIRDHKFIDVIKAEIDKQDLNPLLSRIFSSIIKRIEEINAFEVQGLKETTKIKFYQKLGIKFIIDKKRALLGDRPGLGKTVQALAAAVNAYDGKGAQKILIVCPKISMANVWRYQIEKHLKGNQKVFIMRSRSDLENPKKLQQMKEARFVIVNYEIIRGENAASLRQSLKEHDFDFIIADEAHRMRNDNQVSDAIMEFDAEYKLLVTASAQKGRTIGKIYNLLHWLYPERYTSRKEFFRKYGSEQGFRQLKAELNNFTIRRYVSDVLFDMPKLNIEHRMVQLTGEQARLYRVIEQRFLEELNDPNNGIDAISYLGHLTKAAIDTALIREITLTDPHTGESQKLIPGVTLFEVAGKKYLFTVENGSNIAYLVNKSNKHEKPVPVEFYNNQTAAEIEGQTFHLQLRDRPSYSEKYKVLDEIVDETVHGEGEKLALFTGYVKTVKDLKARYSARGIQVFTLTGEVSPTQRKMIIDAFQKTEEPAIFISTYQTTGESIDLTMAKYGVLIDSPWIDREQIIRRLFRIGQENDVRFTILSAVNSIDQHIEKVNWDAEMIQKIVLDYISRLYKEHDSLLKLYISAGADRKKEQKQLESFRKKIKELSIFGTANETARINVFENIVQGTLNIHFADKQIDSTLSLNGGSHIYIKDFKTLFQNIDKLSSESRELLKSFFETRLLTERLNNLPVKETILWNICEKLIPGFKDIDYDGRLEFIVELGSYIIQRLIKDPNVSKNELLNELEDVPEQLYEQTMFYLDTANIFKLFSMMGAIPQTYFYEGELLRYSPPIRIFYFNGGIQYYDEKILELIAPDWQIADSSIPEGKKGFERIAASVRVLTEAEEKRLANQIRLGNKAAEKILVGSRLRDIIKVAKNAKYRVESIFSQVRGSINISELQGDGQNMLFDIVRDYALNEIYYNQSLTLYLQERLYPRIHTTAFVQANNIFTLNLDNTIYEDKSATVLDMQSVEPEAESSIEERQSAAMLKKILATKGFSETEQDLIALFTFQGYTDTELAVEYAEKLGRGPQSGDIQTVRSIINNFRVSMMKLGKDVILKILQGEIPEEIADDPEETTDEEWEDDPYKEDDGYEDGIYAGSGDKAMRSVGGIDMTFDAMPLRTYGGPAAVDLPALDPAGIDPATFPGFTPVIINITPIYNLYPILGNAAPDNEEDELLSYHF